jgi:two-component system, OmpR family, response regulator MtrA
MSTLSEEARPFTNADDRSDRERVGANLNEQFVSEPNEKPRILIVDNNAQFARSARLLLDQSGKYVVCTVIDPRRALEAGRSFKPDLVLVDLIMQQEDGIEVAAQLEADWALHGVPIVFLTSLITAEEAKDGRRVYGHRILPKPTSNSELIELVEQNLPRCAEVY